MPDCPLVAALGALLTGLVALVVLGLGVLMVMQIPPMEFVGRDSRVPEPRGPQIPILT